MAWAAVAASAAGLVGGAMSASAANRNSRNQANAQNQAGADQRAFDTNNALDVMVRQMRAMYGQQRGDEMLRQFLPPDQYQQLFGNQLNQGRIAELQRQIESIRSAPRMSGGSSDNPNRSPEYEAWRRNQSQLPALQQELARLTANNPNGRWSTGQGPGTGMVQQQGLPGSRPGQPAGSGSVADGGYAGQMQDLINQFVGEQDKTLTDYNTDTGQINAMGDQNLADLYGWGDQRQAMVGRDAERAQRQSAASIGAQMARSGLAGSTIAMQAQSGNARNIFEGAQDRRAGISDQLRALTSQARNENINRLTQRLGGRSVLQTSNLNASQQLRQQPLQAQIGMLTGGAFAPFANRDTRAYFPGVTGNNNASTSLGAALGGNLWGAGSNALMGRLFGNQRSGVGGSTMQDPTMI